MFALRVTFTLTANGDTFVTFPELTRDLNSTSQAHMRNWQQLSYFCEWLHEGLSPVGDATLACTSQL